MKIKLKKSLMLVTLTSLTITPLATLSACGNSSSSIIYELNQELPSGWDANDLMDAVDQYSGSLIDKSDTELVQTFIDLLAKINEVNKVAYSGIDEIYTVDSTNYDVPIYKPGKSGLDAFNFFVARTSKRVFPRIGSFEYDTGYHVIGIHMDGMEYYYASIVPQFTYMKMVSIFDTLSSKAKVNENIKNNNQFATALLTLYLNSCNIFGANNNEFPPDQNIDNFLTALNTFIDKYDKLPYSISNEELNNQVNNTVWGLDKQTGWILLTYYTSKPSVVKAK